MSGKLTDDEIKANTSDTFQALTQTIKLLATSGIPPESIIAACMQVVGCTLAVFPPEVAAKIRPASIKVMDSSELLTRRRMRKP